MLLPNVILLILMLCPLLSSSQGIVDEKDYQFIGYAICGKYWESPCIATLIHRKFLLTSAQCIKRGICSVAALRAHDMNKAIQVRVLRQLVLRPKRIGHTPYLTKNIGLLEILPPTLLDGTIPTARIAKTKVPLLLQSANRCESVRWNEYSGILEYVNIFEGDTDGHFMSCEELMEEGNLAEEDCNKTAIFKQTDSVPDACVSPHGIPLFCEGLLVGLFVKCRNVPSTFYEDISINYVEWSLFQDQLPWMEKVIKNSTVKYYKTKEPPKTEVYILKSVEHQPTVGIPRVTHKLVLDQGRKVDADIVLSAPKFHNAPMDVKPLKKLKFETNNAVMARVILNGDTITDKSPTTQADFFNVSNEADPFAIMTQKEKSSKIVPVEFISTTELEGRPVTEKVKFIPRKEDTRLQVPKMEWTFSPISSRPSPKRAPYLPKSSPIKLLQPKAPIPPIVSKSLEMAKKIPLPRLVYDPPDSKIEDLRIGAESKVAKIKEDYLSRKVALTNEITGILEEIIYKQKPIPKELESEVAKELVIARMVSIPEPQRVKVPKTTKRDSMEVEPLPRNLRKKFDKKTIADDIFGVAVPKKRPYSKVSPDNIFDVELQEEESQDHQDFVFPTQKYDREHYKQFLKYLEEGSLRPPVTFKTIKPLKFKEVETEEDLDDSSGEVMDTMESEVRVKKEINPECERYWHCSSSNQKTRPSLKILCLLYLLLYRHYRFLL